MEANKILESNLLDIVFEGRNKSYGAYELRSNYNGRIKQSLMVTGGICFLFVTGILLANSGDKKLTAPMDLIDVSLVDVTPPPKKEIIPEQPKPQKTEVKTVKITPPIILQDILVDKTEVRPNDDANDAIISTVNKDGTAPVVTAAPAENSTGQAEIPLKIQESKDIYIIESEAKFPGGLMGWKKYLEHALNTEVPIDNGAPAGTYSVVVAFTVDKDGAISDVVALNDPGFGTAEEAMKVIRKSKQWIPALQNGRNVTYRQKQSITFIVTQE